MDETRKLIEQGGGGLVAYIPKQWCDAKGLEAGDTVRFTAEQDDALRLTADTRPEQRATTVTFDGEGRRSIWILINHLYRAGYDRITARYTTEEQFDELEAVVEQYLLGFEVVEHEDGKAVVENVTEPSEEKRRALTRRIFLLIDELFDMLAEALETNTYDRANRVMTIRRKVGKYDNFCRRTLAKKRFSEGNAAFQWLLYVQLYLVSHNLIHFYEAMDADAAPVSADTRALLTELHDRYTAMYEGFFQEDIGRLNQINKPLDELYYTIQEDHLTTATGQEAIAQYYCAELARLLYKTSSYPLLGVVFAAQPDDTPFDTIDT